MKTDIDTADALSLMISWMDVTRFSFAKSSPTTVVAPETRRIMGLGIAGSTQFLSTPRVSIIASAYCTSGLIVSPGFSSLCVGPWKYPWSMGRKSALPSAWIRRESLFFIPHSMFISPRNFLV